VSSTPQLRSSNLAGERREDSLIKAFTFVTGLQSKVVMKVLCYLIFTEYRFLYHNQSILRLPAFGLNHSKRMGL